MILNNISNTLPSRQLIEKFLRMNNNFVEVEDFIKANITIMKPG